MHLLHFSTENLTMLKPEPLVNPSPLYTCPVLWHDVSNELLHLPDFQPSHTEHSVSPAEITGENTLIKPFDHIWSYDFIVSYKQLQWLKPLPAAPVLTHLPGCVDPDFPGAEQEGDGPTGPAIGKVRQDFQQWVEGVWGHHAQLLTICTGEDVEAV